MKDPLIGLSQRYASALRKCLKLGSKAGLRPALRLGREAVDLGVDTLGMARIHEQSAATLNLTLGRQGGWSEAFFEEAITPILESHRAARQTRKDLKRTSVEMTQRTLELTRTGLKLDKGIAKRKTAERALKKCGVHYGKLLQESSQLQSALRQVIRQLLVDHEDERKEMSHQLQDQVAQNLLGINVRLITLKQAARNSLQSLESGIDSAQRLAGKSNETVRRNVRGASRV